MNSFATPLRRLCTLGASLALVTATALTAHAAHAAPPTEGLDLVAVNQSLLATHYWYAQTYEGHPVLGGYLARHVDRSGAVTVDDGRIAVRSLSRSLAGVPQSVAGDTAAKRAGGSPYRSTLVVVPGATSRLAWQVYTDPGHGSVSTLVDAGDGSVISSTRLVKEATGSGKVFNPNPSVTLQNGGLTDANNADSAVFGPAYKTVTLTQMTSNTKLVGAYANNRSASAVTNSTGVFNYNRSQKGFEQVMGYFHITTAQEYLHTLGFTNVNSESQKYKTTGLTDDNSFYDPGTDQITFGTGGVDDAEDSEVIWHEYGHAIQDAQVPGFGSSAQAGAIGEGFGDYWAYTMSQAVSPNTATTPWACIADWDSVSYTSGTPHCLRRTDGTKVYPGGLDGEVHDDGEIWSRALMDINIALGRTNANKVIIEAQFTFATGTTMPAAAQRTVAAAQSLFGSSAASSVTAAFHARGIL